MKTAELKERAKKLKSDIPAVFLALKHPDTPMWAKVLSVIALIYALSPVDLIPDFIPVLGYLDDLIILPALIAAIIKLIPGSVWQSCREGAEGIWQNGAPQKWYCALPFIALWLILLFLIVRAALALIY